MIPDLGKYAFAVLASYGVSLLLLAGLVAYTLARGRLVKRRLDAIERRQVRSNG